VTVVDRGLAAKVAAEAALSLSVPSPPLTSIRPLPDPKKRRTAAHMLEPGGDDRTAKAAARPPSDKVPPPPPAPEPVVHTK